MDVQAARTAVTRSFSVLNNETDFFHRILIHLLNRLKPEEIKTLESLIETICGLCWKAEWQVR